MRLAPAAALLVLTVVPLRHVCSIQDYTGSKLIPNTASCNDGCPANCTQHLLACQNDASCSAFVTEAGLHDQGAALVPWSPSPLATFLCQPPSANANASYSNYSALSTCLKTHVAWREFVVANQSASVYEGKCAATSMSAKCCGTVVDMMVAISKHRALDSAAGVCATECSAKTQDIVDSAARACSINFILKDTDHLNDNRAKPWLPQNAARGTSQWGCSGAAGRGTQALLLLACLWGSATATMGW